MKRIKSFEFIRIIMIFIVVICHFGFLDNYEVGNVYQQFFNNPILAVDFFFMLSGFGMMYARRGSDKVTVKSSVLFAIHKIKKIYPLYVISLVISLPLMIYNNYFVYHYTVLKTVLKTILYFAMDLTLLQSATALYKTTHAVNGVCWFISTLFILYLFTPLLMKIINKVCRSIKSSVIALAIAASILLIVFQVFLLIEKNTFFDQLSYASPYFRVFFLVIGMIIAKLVGYLKEKPLKSMTVYEGLICVLCITWFFLRKTCNKIAIITKFVDVLLCVALIFIFALDNGRISAFMNKSKFADLSGYVMYIYLLHYPVIRTLDTFLNLAAFNIGEFTWIIEVLMIVVITIVLSIIIKHILDSIRKKKSLSISTSS